MSHQRVIADEHTIVQPPRRRDQHWDRQLRARHIEQPGNIGAKRFQPERAAGAGAPCAHAEQAITDRETRLVHALAERIVALGDQHPIWVGCWFEYAFHL